MSAKTNGKHETSPSVVRREKRDNLIAAAFAGVSTSKAAAVPLIEQLRSVPREAVLRIDTPNALGCMDTRSIPVGRLCHEAAAALAEPAPDLARFMANREVTR